jgi:NAD(P)-dependent dehydrogenase (short-subunit alcohol dehydrogenase family)
LSNYKAATSSAVASHRKQAIDLDLRQDRPTKILDKELGPRNIRVNAVSPGGVEIEGVHDLVRVPSRVFAGAAERRE